MALLVRDKLELRLFVETGTFKGDTAEWASGQFEKVWTVEADDALFNSTRERLKGSPNIVCVKGDSRAGLREIVPQLDKPALFWLDAHWCGADQTDTAGAEDQCPLIDEIAIVNSSPYEHVVLVDDARYFLAPPPSPNRLEMWPDAEATVSALKAGRSDRYVAVIDDVFVRVPAAMRGELQGHIDRLTAHREARARKRDARPMRRLKRFLKRLASGPT
ncbi:MAG: hypothetical protein GC202_12085 [Alphaproteobacteria bacterium]|nr:hypothetical protein [Alphaproteobacteria bacterium]